MYFSTEAIVALVSILVGLPPTLLVLWKLFNRRRYRSSANNMNPTSMYVYYTTRELNISTPLCLPFSNYVIYLV